MTRFRRDLDNSGCCNNWKNGIRTINGQYPDDNREFGIVEGAGILITPVTAGIMITNATDPGALEAGQNIELTPNGDHLQIGTTDDIAVAGDLSVAGDSTLNGDLSVNGNIYNQGASYESHMEQVYTEDDYIIMRDNAVTGLAAGDYSGFQVKLYDGINDGRLVMDNSGTARVGDVGYEQPLLTRDEAADLTDGDILLWDGTDQKAVGSDAASVVIPPMNTYMNFQYASKSGFSIGVNTGQYPDAKVTLSEDGVYLLTMRVQFRVNATGDTITAFGFKIGASEIYTNNVYPLNSTGLFRVATTIPFSITGAPVDVYPLVYRTSTGSATSTDTNAIIYSVRIG